MVIFLLHVFDSHDPTWDPPSLVSGSYILDMVIFAHILISLTLQRTKLK